MPSTGLAALPLPQQELHKFFIKHTPWIRGFILLFI